MPVVRWSFPRRQQYRRLRRAVTSAATGLGTGLLAVIAAGASAIAIAIAAALLFIMLALLVHARHWMRLAGRSRIGAHSEDEVRRALAPLEAEGWRLRHSLPYRGRGDIDSVAIAPTRDRLHHRDQDPNVRRTPPRQRAGDGRVAVPPPAAMVPPRSAPGPVRRARQRRGTRAGWGPDRVDRPPGGAPSRGRGTVAAPGVPGRGADRGAVTRRRCRRWHCRQLGLRSVTLS